MNKDVDLLCGRRSNSSRIFDFLSRMIVKNGGRTAIQPRNQ